MMAAHDLHHCPWSRGHKVAANSRRGGDSCKNWETTGECKYGASCAFAHSVSELRSKPEAWEVMAQSPVFTEIGAEHLCSGAMTRLNWKKR